MKTKLAYLFICALIAIGGTACQAIDLPEETPDCVKKLIRKNNVVLVEKWEIGADTYYYAGSDCCDQYNYLYDEECEEVCAPDGGITGNGAGDCPLWTEEPVRTRIWTAE